MTTYSFSDEFIPASGDWMKFDRLGDGVIGTLVEVGEKKGTGNFPDQKIYTLEKVKLIKNLSNSFEKDEEGNNVEDSKGEIEESLIERINVGIKVTNSFVIGAMRKAKIGDIVGFKFSKEIKPKVKGNNPAKSITPFIFGEDTEWKENNKADEISLEDVPFL